MILRGSLVQIESMPDDIRGWPINTSLKQSLIVAPEMHSEPSRYGKVVAIGDGRLSNGKRHVFDVAVGDMVICQRYPKSGSVVKFWGKELFLMSENEILAKVQI